jgi:hypothetical protein
VGFIGRWARFGFGVLFLLFFAANFGARASLAPATLRFYASLALYFVAIMGAYTGVYWILGELGVLERLDPWFSTAIFVGPALVVAWWGFLVEPFTGVGIPEAFWLAMLAYVGISFVVQWYLSYGGCEVVALPILLFRKRFPTYCIPLVALDAVEKGVVDRER